MIDTTTGFIHLNKFSGTSYEECMAALEKLKKLGMKKLIFDLRDNGGGILGEAVDIADEFLDKDKLIVYTQGDKQPKFEYHCKRPGQFEDGNLVVLVNEGSASASEVLAGALQDWDRATIIGRRTFGKGLVQEQYDLTGGAALRLTVARYYTPTGRSIQKSYANGRAAYNDEVIETVSEWRDEYRHHPDREGKLLIKPGMEKRYMEAEGSHLMFSLPLTPPPFPATSPPCSPTSSSANSYIMIMSTIKRLLNNTRILLILPTGFHRTRLHFQGLKAFASENQIRMPDLSPKDRAELNKKIRSWLARQIWGMSGYYQVTNTYDITVQRALKN